jgi:lysozyme
MTDELFNAAKSMLTFEEGDRRYPYDCGTGKQLSGLRGHPTIGIGRNLDAKPLSDAAVDLLFAEDFEECRDACQAIYGVEFFDALPLPRKLALINICFNIGGAGLAKFKSMNSAILKYDWGAAVSQLESSRYARQVPKRALRIKKLLLGWANVY